MQPHRFPIHEIDSDEARRTKLLNILLQWFAGITIIGLIWGTLYTQSGAPDINPNFVPNLKVMLLGILLTYLINLTGKVRLAGGVFLTLLIIVLFITDSPLQLIQGRALFLLTIPILCASALLWPSASFLVTAIIAIGQIGLAFHIGLPPNFVAILGFTILALISWRSARGLEDTLQELRTINRQLDQRIAERTRDLTEANRQLAAACDQLKEVDGLKSSFISMVSHELRTPLNAIQGFAEMLQAEIYGPVTARQEQALKRIIINTEQLLVIVNDLLDQARIEAGQLKLYPAPFSPAEFVHDISSTLNDMAENKGLRLKTRITPAVPPLLYGDRQRLHQIALNLVNNAIKFTDQGWIEVSLDRPSATQWTLAVSDSGPGIPAEAQTYIFDPFRQLDSSNTRRHSGTGLGLAIVQRLVTLMQGTIALKSEVGKGSTFTIVLPLSTQQEEINYVPPSSFDHRR